MTWENIKIETLILSARHCCVCHRYAGLKIEVHHIQPKSKGGEDSIENAIALCFDCHADAGHYNSQHPRGSKFSPKELKLAKERWFELVRKNNISIPSRISKHIHCRHLVLKSVGITRDILNGKLSKLPIDNPLLINNDVSKSVNINLAQLGNYYAYGVDYRSFPDIPTILETYPNIQKVNRSDLDFAYYEYIRVPTKEELLSIKDDLNTTIIQLLNSNVPQHLYVRSLIYEFPGCGEGSDNRFLERFEFRDLWFSFLAIENISRDAITLSELHSSTKENLLISFYDTIGEMEDNSKFPQSPLKPGETALIPTGTIACPFGYEDRDDTDIKRKSLDIHGFPYTLLKHSISDPNSTDYLLFGKYIRPKSLDYSIYGQKYSCDIHHLDPTNLYTIDEYWDCGSCPHLFVQKTDERWYYVKELFAKESEVDQLETVKVDADILKIRIAELENETTFVRFIKQNGKHLYTDMEMVRGNVIEMEVNEGDLIELFGRYRKFFENIPEEEQHVFRNRLIGKYLSEVNFMASTTLKMRIRNGLNNYHNWGN